MCQRGRTGAHSCAQSIRRQAGAPSVQFSPVHLRNFTPVLTAMKDNNKYGGGTPASADLMDIAQLGTSRRSLGKEQRQFERSVTSAEEE